MDLSTNSGDNHACRIRDARGDYTDGEWRGVHYLGDSGGAHATSHTLSHTRKDVQLAADLNNLEGHMYDIDMNPPDYEAERVFFLNAPTEVVRHTRRGDATLRLVHKDNQITISLNLFIKYNSTCS